MHRNSVSLADAILFLDNHKLHNESYLQKLRDQVRILLIFPIFDLTKS